MNVWMIFTFNIQLLSLHIAQNSVLNVQPGLHGVFCWHHIKSVTVGVSTDVF